MEWAALNQAIIDCRLCPRLVAYREEVARTKRRAYRDWEYWGKPVPGFGDPNARVVAIGLAPGAHGSNRTGRMFTGDSSGDFMYPALYRAGFANQTSAQNRQDGLELKDLFITAVCRCAPPDNKPSSSEILACRPFLRAELALLKRVRVIVALGKLAFDQTLLVYRENGADLTGCVFKHGAVYRPLAGMPAIIASYHPSRQNTQTGRLTAAMFDAIWERARVEMGEGS
jgi:uracil-DNA glycosylase family 4